MDFKFIKREITVGGPDLIRYALKRGASPYWKKASNSPVGFEEANSYDMNFVWIGPHDRGLRCEL